jgi:AraC-like DNA-binding protein
LAEIVVRGNKEIVTVVWRASDRSAAGRLDYIRQAVAESIVPFDLRPEDETGFSCAIRSADVGAVRIVDIDAPTSEAVRSRRLIRRSDPEMCTIHLQLRGHPVVEQDDRQVRVRPGDMAFVDLSRPTRVVGAAHRQVSVMFPRALLPLSREDTRRLAGVSISGRDGTGALVGGLVRRIVREPDRYGGAHAMRIGAAVLDLTTAMLATQVGREAAGSPPPRRHVLLTRVQAFIEERLGDPALSPNVIATANHISLRYLHKLFEQESRTVAGLIRERRLERSRHDLADPGLTQVPVRTIALRWGFPDPARFNRLFRSEYGVPPGEYRRLCTSGQPPYLPGPPAAVRLRRH